MMQPTASKTSFAKMLRELGYDVPSIPKASFKKMSATSFTFCWTDSKGEWHRAYYTASGGKPVLQVDISWIRLTLDQAQGFGLVLKKA